MHAPCSPLPAPLLAPQITHKVSWEEPLLPQRVEIDEQGGYILTEAGKRCRMHNKRVPLVAGNPLPCGRERHLVRLPIAKVGLLQAMAGRAEPGSS